MNKADTQKKCDELGIKYQDNDTKEQLDLMIEGVESRETIEHLKAEKETLEAEKSALAEANEGLQAQLEQKDQEADNAGKVLAKVGNKTYEVLGGVNLEGTLYPKEELAKNDKVLKQLVKMESGILKLVD